MKDIFGKHSRRYDAWYENNKFAYLSELEAIKRFLPKTGKGLEIGVGTGRFAGPLGIKWGIDPSEKVLKIARERGVRVRKSHGEKLPFRNNTFDHVVSIVTLSFVRSPARVIQEAERVLKRNGKIIIGIVPRESFLGKNYLKKRGLFYKAANLLTPEEVKDFLKASGFEDISFCQTIFVLPSKMRSVHKVSEGYARGGFVVIRAKKHDKGQKTSSDDLYRREKHERPD
ncbi:MAG: class I SAM-dependent methyltransferase [Candidatus Omnitrophota bacterium]